MDLEEFIDLLKEIREKEEKILSSLMIEGEILFFDEMFDGIVRLLEIYFENSEVNTEYILFDWVYDKDLGKESLISVDNLFESLSKGFISY